GNGSWMVRQSTNGGASWKTIDAISGWQSLGVATVPRSDGLPLPDDIYVSGKYITSSTFWVVRKLTASTVQGQVVWAATNLDNYQLVSGHGAIAGGGVAYNPVDGYLWVTGTGSDGTSGYWITRSTLLQ